MPYRACEKHGGQLYPDDGQCPLCKAGVVTPTKEITQIKPSQPAPKAGGGRKF